MTAEIPASCRDWLRGAADQLIPAGRATSSGESGISPDGAAADMPAASAAADMPAASAAGVADEQLDLVLRARPDLARELMRAWSSTAELAPPDALEELRHIDEPAHQAILLIVVGAYYTHPGVRERLGYTGQQPRAVQIAGDIDEDLLARVIERGPRYRPA